MSKFKIGEHVRATDPNRPHYDLTGRVIHVMDDGEPVAYRIQFGHRGIRAYPERDLTLADPDVHTVLDQMDAESGRVRSKVLRTAESLVNGDRARDYGDPAENFGRIADLWAPILGLSASPEQVALCMAQVKVARLITSPTHSDSWIDLCGYAALGAEIADGS